MKIRISKENIPQVIITVAITVIVAVVGFVMFGLDAGIYSGITAGLSVNVGKEYADSLASDNVWSWNDILIGCSAVLTGVIICVIFYLIR